MTQMDIAEYKRRYGGQDAAAPGWDAIDSRLHAVYPGQEPKHWGTIIKHMLGGPDPLDGISAYQCADGGINHLHFITYGYTSLYYDEDAVGGEYSRWIPTNGPIRLDYDTDIVGLAFLNDPKLEPLDSPHGRVEFIQAFGITQSELDSLNVNFMLANLFPACY